MNYAHTLANRPESDWEPLSRHLEEVADLAAHFASAFGAREWGLAAGLLHDVDKQSAAFQAYLRASAAGKDPGRGRGPSTMECRRFSPIWRDWCYSRDGATGPAWRGCR